MVMSAEILDNLFEANKEVYKNKFGIDWNINPELYFMYLHTLYLADLTRKLEDSLSQILRLQEAMHQVLESIHRKIQ